MFEEKHPNQHELVFTVAPKGVFFELIPHTDAMFASDEMDTQYLMHYEETNVLQPSVKTQELEGVRASQEGQGPRQVGVCFIVFLSFLVARSR